MATADRTPAPISIVVVELSFNTPIDQADTGSQESVEGLKRPGHAAFR